VGILGRSGLAGLERSCAREHDEWVRGRGPVGGVELMQARFAARAFARHRHDTYAVGVTEVGVQAFDYRGRSERALPGQVAVLHPDEPHDGRPGADGGFGYRIVYVDPARIAEALRAVTGRPSPLPFVPEPVVDSPALAAAVTAAFRLPPEPLALDAVVLALAEGLLAASEGIAAADSWPAARPGRAHRAAVASVAPLRRVDRAAVARARTLLDNRPTVVLSAELEAVAGLSRYELARQFRQVNGTSPHRYSVLRRLDLARSLLVGGTPLADAAIEAGFADQAHFTRAFRAAFGLTPGRYRALRRQREGSRWL
jgi:AraC-like DNA-binding protein